MGWSRCGWFVGSMAVILLFPQEQTAQGARRKAQGSIRMSSSANVVPCTRGAGAGGRDGLRRKAHRSLYLPWLAGRPPGLSTITPPQGRASLDTINAATMRPCGVDHPAAGRACVLLRSRLGVTALQSRPPCRSPPSAAGRLPLISRPMATLRLMTQILPSPHRGARAGTP